MYKKDSLLSRQNFILINHYVKEGYQGLEFKILQNSLISKKFNKERK